MLFERRYLNFEVLGGISKELVSVMNEHYIGVLPVFWIKRFKSDYLLRIIATRPIGVVQIRGKMQIIYGYQTFRYIEIWLANNPQHAVGFNKIAVNFYKKSTPLLRAKYAHDELINQFITIPKVTGILGALYAMYRRKKYIFETVFEGGVNECKILTIVGSKSNQESYYKEKYDKAESLKPNVKKNESLATDDYEMEKREGNL